MPKRIEYTKGQTLGECLFIREVEQRGAFRRAIFKCRCGAEFESFLQPIKTGQQRSCGCLKKEAARASRISNLTHGHSMPGSKYYKEYRAWQTIRNKCLNPEYINFKYYGGRGVQMCLRWQECFDNFLSDMGPCPADKDSIDRYPNNETGNYEPYNCRWANMKEQANNRRSCRLITFNGLTMNMTQWSEKANLPEGVLSKRLKRGWGMQRALGITELAAIDNGPVINYAFGYIN